MKTIESIDNEFNSPIFQTNKPSGFDKRLALSVASFILSASVAYAIFGYKPHYTASAEVLIKDSALYNRYIGSSDSINESASSALTNPVLNTMELLKTSKVMSPFWYYLDKNHPEQLQHFKLKSLDDWNQYVVRHSKKLLQAKNVPGTDMITVQFTWTDPISAKDGLNLILREFKQTSLEMNQAEQHEQSVYLDSKIKDIQARLQSVRNEISQFKRSHKSVDISKEREHYATTRIELANTMANLKSDAASKQAEIGQIQNMLKMDSKAAVQSSAVGGNETLATLQGQLYSLNQQYGQMKARYRENNPKMKALASEIQEIQQNIALETHRTLGENNTNKVVTSSSHTNVVADRPRTDAISNLLSDSASARGLQAKSQALQQYMSQLDAELATLPHSEETLANLEDKETILRESLQTLEQKSLNAKIREMQTLSNVFIVQPPLEPKEGNFPSRSMVIVLGAIMSLLSGFGVAYLKNKLLSRRQSQNISQSFDFLAKTEVEKELVLTNGKK